MLQVIEQEDGKSAAQDVLNRARRVTGRKRRRDGTTVGSIPQSSAALVVSG